MQGLTLGSCLACRLPLLTCGSAGLLPWKPRSLVEFPKPLLTVLGEMDGYLRVTAGALEYDEVEKQRAKRGFEVRGTPSFSHVGRRTAPTERGGVRLSERVSVACLPVVVSVAGRGEARGGAAGGEP